MKKTAPVNKIIPFSNVDGPGNRTAVFFQGCNLRCLFCHNAETIRRCVHCGICVETCPAGALSIDTVAGEGKAGESRRVRWDSGKCVNCDTCIHVCPHLASPKVRWLTAEELIREIERTAPYINGVTFSGGECTIERDFLLEVIPGIRSLGLSVLLDSNGTYDFEQDPELLAAADGVMLDVKAANPAFCRELTGEGPELPFKNLLFLQKAGKLEEVRTVLFPHREKENEETVRAVAALLDEKTRYKLLRYRPFGVREEGKAVLGEEITAEEEGERLAALARSLGAKNTVSV